MFEYQAEYKNFRGVHVKETLYFHFSKQELINMQVSSGGLLTERLQRIIDTNDNNKALMEIKDIILLAYGEISPNGNRFYKSDESRKDFEASPAFDAIYMKMFTDPAFSGKFLAGILPEGIDPKEIEKAASKMGVDLNAVYGDTGEPAV